MRTIIVAALLACLAGNAVAEGTEQRESEQAVYYVTDRVNEQNSRVESWDISSDTSGRIDTGPYTIRKTAFGKKGGQETTSDGRWQDEIRAEGQDTYLVERYDAHPAMYTEEGTGFGYFEIRKTEDDEVVDNWPVFFEIQEISGAAFRMTLRGYASDGRTHLVMRDYLKDRYFAPLRESRSVIRGGNVVSNLTLTRAK